MVRAPFPERFTLFEKGCRRLLGPWTKMSGYLARLSLILALCRAVDEGEPEQVEGRDVLAATVLLDYFKYQAPPSPTLPTCFPRSWARLQTVPQLCPSSTDG